MLVAYTTVWFTHCTFVTHAVAHTRTVVRVTALLRAPPRGWLLTHTRYAPLPHGYGCHTLHAPTLSFLPVIITYRFCYYRSQFCDLVLPFTFALRYLPGCTLLRFTRGCLCRTARVPVLPFCRTPYWLHCVAVGLPTRFFGYVASRARSHTVTFLHTHYGLRVPHTAHVYVTVYVPTLLRYGSFCVCRPMPRHAPLHHVWLVLPCYATCRLHRLPHAVATVTRGLPTVVAFTCRITAFYHRCCRSHGLFWFCLPRFPAHLFTCGWLPTVTPRLRIYCNTPHCGSRSAVWLPVTAVLRTHCTRAFGLVTGLRGLRTGSVYAFIYTAARAPAAPLLRAAPFFGCHARTRALHCCTPYRHTTYIWLRYYLPAPAMQFFTPYGSRPRSRISAVLYPAVLYGSIWFFVAVTLRCAIRLVAATLPARFYAATFGLLPVLYRFWLFTTLPAVARYTHVLPVGLPHTFVLQHSRLRILPLRCLLGSVLLPRLPVLLHRTGSHWVLPLHTYLYRRTHTRVYCTRSCRLPLPCLLPFAVTPGYRLRCMVAAAVATHNVCLRFTFPVPHLPVTYTPVTLPFVWILPRLYSSTTFGWSTRCLAHLCGYTVARFVTVTLHRLRLYCVHRFILGSFHTYAVTFGSAVGFTFAFSRFDIRFTPVAIFYTPCLPFDYHPHTTRLGLPDLVTYTTFTHRVLWITRLLRLRLFGYPVYRLRLRLYRFTCALYCVQFVHGCRLRTRYAHTHHTLRLRLPHRLVQLVGYTTHFAAFSLRTHAFCYLRLQFTTRYCRLYGYIFVRVWLVWLRFYAPRFLYARFTVLLVAVAVTCTAHRAFTFTHTTRSGGCTLRLVTHVCVPVVRYGYTHAVTAGLRSHFTTFSLRFPVRLGSVVRYHARFTLPVTDVLRSTGYVCGYAFVCLPFVAILVAFTLPLRLRLRSVLHCRLHRSYTYAVCCRLRSRLFLPRSPAVGSLPGVCTRYARLRLVTLPTIYPACRYCV